MELKDKDGKPISLEGIDPKVVAVLTAINGSHAAQIAQLAGKIPNAEELTSKIAEIGESVKKLGERKPDDKPPAKPGDGNDVAALIKAALDEALTPYAEKIDALSTERQAEKASATSKQIAEAFVAEHYPNLKGKDRMVNRIAAAKVSKPEEAKAIADDFIADLTSTGIKIESLTSKPESEGGKPGSEGDDKDAKKAELQERIRSQNPNAVTTAA